MNGHIRGTIVPVEEVDRHLMLRRRSEARGLRKALASGSVVRIHCGAYLDADYLRSLPDRWHATRAVGLARILATSLDRQVTVIGASAAILHGVPQLDPSPPVHLWAPTRPGGTSPPLPAVRLPHGGIVPAGRTLVHTGAALGSDFSLASGRESVGALDTLPLAGAIASATLIALPRDSFVLASGGIRMMCGFDRRRQDHSRVEEESARAQLLDMVHALPARTRNRRVALWTLHNADAGCESVGEALLLWILRSHGIVGTLTQVRVAAGSRTYYIDIGIPGVLLAIEFDGSAKYGEDGEEVLDAFKGQERRQKDIEREGFLVLRFRWSELGDPPAVLSELRARLASVGRTLPVDPSATLTSFLHG